MVDTTSSEPVSSESVQGQLEHTLRELADLLEEFAPLNPFHEPARNLIRPPMAAPESSALMQKLSIDALPEVRDFYRLCNGLSLPDVYNGYFVHGLDEIERSLQQGAPTTLAGQDHTRLLPIGSDGGGALFAVNLDHHTEILYLPPAYIVASTYHGEATEVRVLAQTFTAFLARICDDFRAFLERTPGWSYMTDASQRSS